MKTFVTILLFLGSMFASLIASLVITWFAWRFQITDKAFHCTDDNLSGFWCDMNTHRAAGDNLLGGWTWDELKVVRIIYEIVFYMLWLGGSAFMFWFLRRFFKSGHARPNTVLDPTTTVP